MRFGAAASEMGSRRSTQGYYSANHYHGEHWGQEVKGGKEARLHSDGRGAHANAKTASGKDPGG